MTECGSLRDFVDRHRDLSVLTGACLGLVPRRYQSGEVYYVGGISKCGDRRLRTLLYEATASSMRAISSTPATDRIASNVLIVPTGVVQHGQNGLFVFIVDERNRAPSVR